MTKVRPRINAADVTAVVDKLKVIALQLPGGRGCNITRLTILKRLCEDPQAAAKLGLYIVNRVQAKTAKKYKPLVREAIRQLKNHIAKRRKTASESLWTALWALENSQREIKHHHWVDVRIIHSREALLAEYALRIAARPRESAFCGYRMARYHVERYDPHYGNGLIPESLPALNDIIRFWSRYAASLRTKEIPRAVKPAVQATTRNKAPKPGACSRCLKGRSLRAVRSLRVQQRNAARRIPAGDTQ